MRYGIVEQRRRRVARISLYGSLVVIGLATAVAQRHLHLPENREIETNWAAVDWNQDPVVRLLQQLIRIDSSPSGDELAAALFLAGPLETAGLEVHVERLGERNANVWAILEGEEPGALVLHNHLDVEPANMGKDWVFPPFAGVMHGPWLHGRGAFDMKSVTVAQLWAVLELAATHPRPRRSVIFLGTSMEERGSDLGMRWILREHPELAGRFWGVLTEGGVVEARSLESIKYWGTEVGQKRFPELYACAASEQRLLQLREDLRNFSPRVAELSVDPDIRRFWSDYRSTRDLAAFQELLADPDALARDPARYLELPEYLQRLMRNDVFAFKPRPAPGGGWEMRILLHLLPGADYAEEKASRFPPWMTAGVALVETSAAPPVAVSPLDHQAMQAIDQALVDRYGEIPRGPFFLPATMTDARFLRARNVPSYGFSPFFFLSPDTLRLGLPNERISASALVDGAQLYSNVVERIAMGGD
jgi:acetylornithine deacetylase/succinyl-diaminopimelate desuccinylase-like protein